MSIETEWRAAARALWNDIRRGNDDARLLAMDVMYDAPSMGVDAFADRFAGKIQGWYRAAGYERDAETCWLIASELWPLARR